MYRIAFLLLVSCGEPCAWEIERGFEYEFHEFTAECWWDRAKTRDPEELCYLKAANRGLVKWVCK